MKERKRFHIMLIGFCTILYFIWTILEIFIVPEMELQLTIDIIKEVLLKILLWFIPALALSIHFREQMYLQDLFKFRTEWLKCLPLFLIFAAYHVISAYIQNGFIAVSDSFKASDIIIACTVGLSEEMVFRGLLLNSMLHMKQKWIPVLINAVMFLLIHFPVWFRSGLLLAYMTNGAFLQLILLSIIFSLVFLKSKNIIMPAALHAFWDLLCWLL